jgi:hypothetical protein
MDPRVIIQKLDRAVDLGFAAVLFDGSDQVIDPPEQLFVLAVDRADAGRQFVRPLHKTISINA